MIRKALITGAAGFIGYHFCQQLLAEDYSVVGLDNLNHYYDVNLKLARIRRLGIDPTQVAAKRLIPSKQYPQFSFIEMDLTDKLGLRQLFALQDFTVVINLAAQAGVRYSLENPQAYLDSNVLGFANLLECCRFHPVEHLVFASSSSVYGNTTTAPFTTDARTDSPVSLYAATKKTNELMAYSYSHLYNIPVTGLRFFTVYGEWGRPDMATMLFAKAILNQTPIRVFNEGNMSRDFTYVGDIVEGMRQVLAQAPKGTPRYKIYNIGKGAPVTLNYFIDLLEELLGRTTDRLLLAMQAGDVKSTFADVSALQRDFNFLPQTGLREGLTKFVTWYKTYHHPAGNQ